MWLWHPVLARLGFRRRSERYWRCDERFGLAPDEHLSLWPWSEQKLPGGYLVELTEFHVTFVRFGEHLHFYYHLMLDHQWQPGGHTSTNELYRLGLHPGQLRARADAIAAALIDALGGTLMPRDTGM